MKRLACLMAALVVACLVAAATVEAAVVRGEGHYTYYGLQSDTKPTSPQAGDRFVETDNNGKVWEYSGSAWIQTYVNTTPGTIQPGEDANINRIAVTPKCDCTTMTADGVIKASSGVLCSIMVTNASANDDLIIYDNASAASGTKRADWLNLAAGTTFAPWPAALTNGAYLDLTTAGSMHVDVCVQ